MERSANAAHVPLPHERGSLGRFAIPGAISAVMLRLLIFPVLPLLFVGHYSGPPRRPVLGGDVRVEAQPIVLDARDPERRQIGPLVFLGGWELKGRDDAFGGFSAMATTNGRLQFLTDAGGLVNLKIDGAGRVENIRFADLPGGPGRGWLKEDRDTESMARDPETGRVWIGFERVNAIWRYSRDLKRVEASAQPLAMRDWPENGGAEAIVRLRSGRFLVFSERAGASNTAPGFQALAFDRDPTDPAAQVTRFAYRPPRGYRVTDAVEMADGRLLLLHRKIAFRPYLSARLTLLDPSEIRAGAVLLVHEIARFDPPLAVDNMEAMALEEDGRGGQILWIASDDNFRSPFQRNLLLKFALMPIPAS
ncbi:esterase-like activity of phytase family protein [Sphingomonas sp. LaA6.9]|uniref:esterase-like activity of phytase family protein n=1 Tax=Sphingomonas sp. LaA6.9 TaxID=2919914 RepID=UPI001F4F76E9|nr:esterase-like activity of phytase family protein [Sphingomonas sp. LaA6.9]MCJ8158922.1 esterase-like activity of phytase family protein [Sphingomonas sp. LaA6.9]